MPPLNYRMCPLLQMGLNNLALNYLNKNYPSIDDRFVTYLLAMKEIGSNSCAMQVRITEQLRKNRNTLQLLTKKCLLSESYTQLVIAQEFLFQLKENGEKDDLDTADPDCATVSKKFSFFEHYEEEKSKTVEHKVSRTNCPLFTFFGVK